MNYWNKKSLSGEVLDHEPSAPTTANPGPESYGEMVSEEWQAEMARMLALMDGDELVTSPSAPPISLIRQRVPQQEHAPGERGSHLQPQGSETASATKAG